MAEARAGEAVKGEVSDREVWAAAAVSVAVGYGAALLARLTVGDWCVSLCIGLVVMVATFFGTALVSALVEVIRGGVDP